MGHHDSSKPRPAPWADATPTHGISAGGGADRRAAPSRMVQVPSDSSSSETDLHPRPRLGRSSDSHTAPGRSARETSPPSHSLSSLFSGRKNRRRRTKTSREDSLETESESGSSTADIGTDKPPHLLARSQERKHSVPAQGTKDFTTGACMTCGSLVRWPRNRSIFKCTICLAINSLAPTPPGWSRDGSGSARHLRVDLDHPVTSSRKGVHSPSSIRQLSLQHTRELVKRCLDLHLRGISAASDSQEATAPAGTPSQQPSETRDEPETPAGSKFQFDVTRAAGNVSDEGGTSQRPVHQPRVHRRARSSLVFNFDVEPSSSSFKLGPSRETVPPEASGADAKHVFKAVEDYILEFLTAECLNESFMTPHSASAHTQGPGLNRQPSARPRRKSENALWPVADVDAKLLLLGDFAENGSWWTGRQADLASTGSMPRHHDDTTAAVVSTRSPRIDWTEVDAWYAAITDAGGCWKETYDELRVAKDYESLSDEDLQRVGVEILAAQGQLRDVLLLATERMLRNPGRPISEPRDLRFLLITMANPLLQPTAVPVPDHPVPAQATDGVPTGASVRNAKPPSIRHAGIAKRILGMLSNSSLVCHRHLAYWFARFPEPLFLRIKAFIHKFLTYRLLRHREKRTRRQQQVDVTDDLIPRLSARPSPASFHDALGQVTRAPSSAQRQPGRGMATYHEDWQVRAAVRVMALLFAANKLRDSAQARHGAWGLSVQPARGLLHTSDFYVALLDDCDLVGDFEAWEQKRARFCFCQYPFLLSIGAKIQILEHDARRQMQTKARDAFFDSLMSHRAVDQHFVLNVRRDCLVEDSLREVSEAVGSGGEDIKKGLRIVFRGEEGVDAGGLRKEWFLLLVREVFHPDHGLFIYDEDSQYCYFNPNTLETSDQFFLVGVVLGLAIYNSTILDVALPPFAFRKLLNAAPPAAAGAVAVQTRPPTTYTIDDLAEYRPRLAKGLRQLLEYDGDVESTFALNFVIEIEKYGARDGTPLCAGGDRRAVTSANRREYVELYVRHLLDHSVARQFEPFKRGFFSVCGGNALSLFGPDEIERLVRGSDEALDVDALRSAAVYENWGVKDAGRTEPTVQWFWQSLQDASPERQRKLLGFVTGSDRIPALGAASLSIKVSCLGEDCGRYPTARTCFNALSLWRYKTRERLETLLWRAVYESEGFGLK